MIGDRIKQVIANARGMTWPMRMIVSLSGTPLIFMDTPQSNLDLVATFGNYHLMYANKTRNGEDNVKKFSLVFDFGRKFLKCSNFTELKTQAVTNDIARFFLKYTNICDEMFAIASQNEKMHIPVTFDIVKYNQDIRKQLGVEDYNKYVMLLNPFKPTHGSRWDVDTVSGNLYYKDLDRPELRIDKEEIKS